MWGVDQGSEFSSHRLGFAGRDTAEMVFDLVVLRIVGRIDKLAFGYRIGQQQ